MESDTYHISVLPKEVVEYLAIRPGKKYIDATLGGGGHTSQIVALGGRVLGIDVDEEALRYVESRIKNLESRGEHLQLAHGNFKDIDTIAKEAGFENVSGILFDLGVSSHQLDEAERGFSFQHNGPLDMRMGRDLNVQAKDLVNALGRNELKLLFERFGEERFAGKIASTIVEKRKAAPIETTEQLARIVRSVVRGEKHVDPATRVFQALRIAVNDELESIAVALPKAVELLEPGGRLVVISFHSLEDRIVKHALLEFEAQGLGTILTKKPIVPSEEEQETNRRSRSAKLRIFEKN